jgi:hypothetical protein
MTARRFFRSLLAVVPTIALIGCSRSLDDLPREAVAGTVTMDGKPLPAGVIQFYPMGEGSATTTAPNGEIKDGAFSIPREHGAVPGKYKVAISHAELKAAEGKARKKGLPERSKVLGPEQIPAKYNTQTKLETEIKAGGARDLKYDLQSK